MKNLWGAQWGEAGFMRLRRNVTGERDGQAGLATFPGYAFKTSPNPSQVGGQVAGGGGWEWGLGASRQAGLPTFPGCAFKSSQAPLEQP